MATLLIAEHDNKILNEANKKAMSAATVSYTHLTLPTNREV